MPTEVIKTIGSAAGRDYATIQAWIDASPASLVTDDVVWIGELYNDSIYSFSGNFSGGVTFSGKTTDATRYYWLRAAKGEGFRDAGGPLTRPSVDRGVFIQSTQTNATLFNKTTQKLVTTGLQIEQTQSSGVIGNPDFVDSCIIAPTNNLGILATTVTNSLLLHRAAAGITNSLQDNFDGIAVGLIKNCTIVTLQPRLFMQLNNSSGKRMRFKNCLFAGYSTSVQPSLSLFIANPDCSNNYTSMQTLPGINNKIGGLQYPFVGTNDFRPLALPQLSDSLTSPDCTQDIYGNFRGCFSYYGCAQGVPIKTRQAIAAQIAGFKAYWHRRQQQVIGGGLK